MLLITSKITYIYTYDKIAFIFLICTATIFEVIYSQQVELFGEQTYFKFYRQSNLSCEMNIIISNDLQIMHFNSVNMG